MSSRLIVSVSGIRDKHVEAAHQLLAELDRRQVPASLLVAPRRGEKYRLVDDPDTQEWLRDRHGRGDAIVLGGYDEAATKRRRSEFASIGRSEARVRLTAADRMMSDMGLRTRLFAPPRWNASPGCLEALPQVGFRLCADVTGIHDVARGTFERGRVLSMGEGFVADSVWCRAMIAGAGRVAKVGGLVRLNVAAKHLHRSTPRAALLDAIDLVTTEYGSRPARYEWLPDHPRGEAVAQPGADAVPAGAADGTAGR